MEPTWDGQAPGARSRLRPLAVRVRRAFDLGRAARGAAARPAQDGGLLLVRPFVVACADLISDLLGAVLKLSLAADKYAEVEARAKEVGLAFKERRQREAYEGLRRMRRACATSKQRRPAAAPVVQLASGDFAASVQEGRERWLEYFAAQEHADVTDVGHLARADAARRSAGGGAVGGDLDLSLVPTLAEVESLCRAGRSRKGRQPGLDGIPDEVYAACPCAMARVLHPLLVKVALRVDSPWPSGAAVSWNSTRAGAA